MPENEKKGITVKVDAQLHAQVREYIEAHGMTMSEFVAKALDSELHPSQTRGGVNVANRTLAFQVPEELYQRFDTFSAEFTERYLQFSSGAGQIWTDYARVRAYVLKGSDLDDRLDRTLRSYLEYMHNSNFNFGGYQLNDVKPLGNNIYILDISCDAGSQMPAGYKEVHRDMNVFVQYFPGTNEVFAFSAEDYNTEERDAVG